jgi:hypothetical protein
MLMERSPRESTALADTEMPDATSRNGGPVSDPANRVRKVLALTDTQGRRAIAWRKADAWVVRCDDASFKRRIQRALRKPVWIREDVPGPDGERWSTLVEVRPGDPRHSRQIFWSWHQLGLQDVKVEIVSAPTLAPPAATM